MEYAPYHLRAWAGFNASGWFRVLVKNRFAVSLTRIPMALVITLLCGMNSALGWLQMAVFDRRIRETKLPADPIFVLGHWRSGTTLLHELLVCDERFTFPDTYACFAPNHFLLTGGFLPKLITFFMPPKRPMDNMPIRWEYPQEEEWALCNLGLPSPYLTILFPNEPPQDPEYFDLRNVPPAQLDHWKQVFTWFLQALTFRTPKRLVLKTPLHTARVRALLAMFPNARFVHVVRDPYAIFPSMMHTWRQLYRWEGVQAPRYDGLEDQVLDAFERMYRVFDEDIQLLPPGSFCEVRYEDLKRDMVGEVGRIYEQLGLGGFEQAVPAIEKYAANRESYATNRFELAPELRDRITERWQGYLQKYGYEQRTAQN